MDEETATNIVQRVIAADRITMSDLQELIEDDTASASDGLAWLLVNRPELIGGDSHRSLSEVVVNRLCALAVDDDPQLTAFDALQYLRALFVVGWRSGGRANPCVQHIVSRLPTMVSSWPSPKADKVVLVFMEHVLPMPGVLQLFENWQHDAVLAPILREAKFLAGISSPDENYGR